MPVQKRPALARSLYENRQRRALAPRRPWALWDHTLRPAVHIDQLAQRRALRLATNPDRLASRANEQAKRVQPRNRVPVRSPPPITVPSSRTRYAAGYACFPEPAKTDRMLPDVPGV